MNRDLEITRQADVVRLGARQRLDLGSDVAEAVSQVATRTASVIVTLMGEAQQDGLQVDPDSIRATVEYVPEFLTDRLVVTMIARPTS